MQPFLTQNARTAPLALFAMVAQQKGSQQILWFTVEKSVPRAITAPTLRLSEFHAQLVHTMGTLVPHL
jgi:hypothetical protein